MRFAAARATMSRPHARAVWAAPDREAAIAAAVESHGLDGSRMVEANEGPPLAPSDQAMLNHWLRSQPPIAEWTERDGFVTFYGAGYERHVHLGVGPSRPALPAGARIVVLGSDDLAVLDQPARYPWVASWV
jgi:hypothetical protein